MQLMAVNSVHGSKLVVHKIRDVCAVRMVELMCVSCHITYPHPILINQTLLFNMVINFKLGTAKLNNLCSRELLNTAT
jgi:hypothetical protein